MWASDEEIQESFEQVAPFPTREDAEEARTHGEVWIWDNSGTLDDGVQFVNLICRDRHGFIVDEIRFSHYEAFADASSFLHHSRDHRSLEEKLSEECEFEERY